MHPICGALPVPYVPVGLTCGALGAHRYTYAPSHYRRTFIPLSGSLWDDILHPVFDGVELVGFNNRANAFLLALATCSLLSSTVFPFLFFISHFLSIGWYFGAGVFGLTGCRSLSPSLVSPTISNSNNKNNNNNNN